MLMLIVVEDAQWIDPTSRELLDLLCERLSRLRVLLLVTARTGFSPAWLAADNCTSLTLRRLAKRYGMTMVRQLCGARSLPPEDIERITIAAEGVPLFIEELSRAVLEARASGASGNGPEQQSSTFRRPCWTSSPRAWTNLGLPRRWCR